MKTIKNQSEPKQSVLDLSDNAFKTKLKELGLPTYLQSQIQQWVFTKSVLQFSKMRNISKTNQQILAENFRISPFEKTDSIKAADKSAIKYCLTLPTSRVIEAVVIQERKYKTLCMSSQCGCPLDCQFCVTGKMGFLQNLTPAEIVGQFLQAQADGHQISRIVFMGMGEPLLNYQNVLTAIEMMTDPKKGAISNRKITVSTAGVLKCIQQLIDDKIKLNLAFSVGSPNPLKRIKLMPVEKNNPIIKVARKLQDYTKTHNRKLTLEYTLLKGENDSIQDCQELANMALFLNAKINLIQFNPHPKLPYTPTDIDKTHQFQKALSKLGAACTLRISKGQDIVAGCGQLGDSYNT